MAWLTASGTFQDKFCGRGFRKVWGTMFLTKFAFTLCWRSECFNHLDGTPLVWIWPGCLRGLFRAAASKYRSKTLIRIEKNGYFVGSILGQLINLSTSSRDWLTLTFTYLCHMDPAWLAKIWNLFKRNCIEVWLKNNQTKILGACLF